LQRCSEFQEHAMSTRRHFSHRVLKATVAATLIAASLGATAQSAISLLNVSYDPTRELYSEIDAVHKNGGWLPADWQKRKPSTPGNCPS
jgi:ABC-type sulfate transport system substrate-binding protein